MANFANSGFNDKAHSAVVHEGRWEICFDADFHGSCGVLTPGAYPDLGAYAGRVSSVRPVDGRPSHGRSDDRGPRSDDRGYNREARATLFEGPGMTGRSFALNDTMRDLDRTRFNDRASSLRVESGYWIFCSDAEFRGECRTFGPGEYATLPGMDNAISSGRRISNAYPYGDRPNWQRDPLRRARPRRSPRKAARADSGFAHGRYVGQGNMAHARRGVCTGSYIGRAWLDSQALEDEWCC